MQRSNETTQLNFRTEDLAVPEVVTGVVEEEELEPDTNEDTIVYEDLALPEIHIHPEPGNGTELTEKD